MNERLKSLRKELGYTQVEFSRLLGYTQPAYARLESQATPISQKHINLICSKFDVNEDWFKTGCGHMFNEKHKTDDFVRNFMSLDEASQNFVLEMTRTLLSRQQEGE